MIWLLCVRYVGISRHIALSVLAHAKAKGGEAVARLRVHSFTFPKKQEVRHPCSRARARGRSCLTVRIGRVAGGVPFTRARARENCSNSPCDSEMSAVYEAMRRS
jgi:hypothetical protein